MSHPDYINEALVAKLIRDQFPHWSGLPVHAVDSDGWDNCTFHLGDAMLVRLPSEDFYVAQVDKEQRWLPWLAPQLPFPVPRPLAKGQPSELFDRPWSVFEWLPGESAESTPACIPGLVEPLSEFLHALHRVDASEGPVAGTHNFYRGGDLSMYGNETRKALKHLRSSIDSDCNAVWELAIASRWDAAPVWVHGDLAPSNLLVTSGVLSAVIDFGCCGVGDPACDLVIAWTDFDDESRERFRAALSMDEATWQRARGWALWKSSIVLVNPEAQNLHASARQTIERILADHRQQL